MRDTKSKQVITFSELHKEVPKLLKQIQEGIYLKALKKREENSFYPDTLDEFRQIMEAEGGFAYAHWDGTSETELKIKEMTKATIRCIPFDRKEEKGKCILTGKPSEGRVIFAKAY